jgi:hypothetical protein
MIDMNQSIEEIMNECDYIAMNEFKSDVKAYYSRRIADEEDSGRHYKDKHASVGEVIRNNRAREAREYHKEMNSKSAIHGTGRPYGGFKHKSSHNQRQAEYKNIDIKARADKDMEWRNAMRDNDSVYNHGNYTGHYIPHNSNERKRNRKATNESSIFDDLLNLI